MPTLVPVTSLGHAYVVGIGGIGASAVAQWLQALGWRVSGTDRAPSVVTETLQREGITVDISELPTLPPAVDRLVYSDAVPNEHPARAAARARGIPEVSYPALLGELTKGLSTFAVSGSHGKSTTTALIGLLLEAVGADPTVVIGTRVPQWGGPRGAEFGNFRRGGSRVAVVEADEYRGHFLALRPQVAVVTSVDHDHVDAFPTSADYQAAFAAFLARVPSSGLVVLPAADAATAALRRRLDANVRVKTFGVDLPAAGADVVAAQLRTGEGKQTFQLWIDGQDRGEFVLSVPGRHVVADALAAIAAVADVSVSDDLLRRVLADFKGTWRRFEHVGDLDGVPVISDYAHHPTELRALLDAARQWYPDRRLVIAFQPHQRARTKAFAAAFIDALRGFDAVVLAEVYDVAGREASRGQEEEGKVTTRNWVPALTSRTKDVTFAPTLDAVSNALRSTARPGDVVLVVGAGDIDTVARQLASH